MSKDTEQIRLSEPQTRLISLLRSGGRVILWDDNKICTTFCSDGHIFCGKRFFSVTVKALLKKGMIKEKGLYKGGYIQYERKNAVEYVLTTQEKGIL